MSDVYFQYIAELTLLDPDCLQHSPSIQAAAILCLALHMSHKPPWVSLPSTLSRRIVHRRPGTFSLVDEIEATNGLFDSIFLLYHGENLLVRGQSQCT